MQKVPTLYEQVVESIREHIISEKLDYGSQLPSQKALSEKYYVSLITIKRAISELVQEGILYAQPGKGVFVGNLNHQFVKKSSLVNSVGSIINQMLSPFYSSVLSGVEAEAAEKDYVVIFSNPADTENDEEKQIFRLKKMGVKGFIVASRRHSKIVLPYIDKLHRQKIPIVFVSYVSDNQINYIGCDHQTGAYMATEHLIKLDYKRIVYVTPDQNDPLSILRYRGYSAALLEAGRTQNEVVTISLNTSYPYNRFEAGYELGLRILEMSKRPDAVFAFSDLVALGIKRAFLKNGLQIPKDLAIVGFDDTSVAEHSLVPLTTVRQPVEKIGRLAFDTLLRMINGDHTVTRIFLAPELVIRDSCGASLKN